MHESSEEGARFPKSMVASQVWAGDLIIDDAWDLRDIADPSISLKSELERHGFMGEVKCSSNEVDGYPLGAHFELHIEQGPILANAGRQIGVVKGVQAYRWLTFHLKGRNAHTGTTPLAMRKDPLLAASKMIAASNTIAKELGALASTGVFRIPQVSSTNTVPSEVSFTLDIRHPDTSMVVEMQERCLDTFQRISKEDGQGIQFDWTVDTISPAVKFDADALAVVANAANSVVGPDGWLQIDSGAGHDSVNTSKRCPTAMIFVPCRDGISHHPEEFCRPEDWYVISS